MNSKPMGNKKYIFTALSIIIALLIWQFVSSSDAGAVIASPADVFKSFIKEITNGKLLHHIAISLFRVLSGFALAFIVSIPIAFLMGWYQPIQLLIEPIIQFLRNIPALAYIPLVVVAQGVGESAKITVIFISTFLVMIITVYQGVKEVEFESKDQAFAKMEGSSDYNKEILAGYSKENNPLPASYIVRLEGPEVASNVESAMKTDNKKYMDGVEDVGNDEELIGTINSFVKVINTVGLVLGIVFVGVSLFLIVNTIKITVYSRRREVGIMKFVGATDWFIRWPFVIEGVIIGLVGGILSTLLLFAGYNFLYGKWYSFNTFIIRRV